MPACFANTPGAPEQVGTDGVEQVVVVELEGVDDRERGIGPFAAHTMKAFIIERYGSGRRVRASDMPDPAMRADDVLVQIHAAGVNVLDSKIKSGELKRLLPYRLPVILGNDVAGVVVKFGVRRFKPGDEVYARPDHDRIGTFAELIAIKGNPPEQDEYGLPMQMLA